MKIMCSRMRKKDVDFLKKLRFIFVILYWIGMAICAKSETIKMDWDSFLTLSALFTWVYISGIIDLLKEEKEE